MEYLSGPDPDPEVGATDVPAKCVPAPDLPPKWVIKQLRPQHKQAASLIAQGMKYKEVASIMDFTPEYISMLMAQPLFRSYVDEMCKVAGTRLEAMFPKAVEVIAEVMERGSEKGKLAAVRLQLEATKRIGRPDTSPRGVEDNVGRLEKLAERLVALQSNVRARLIKPGEEIIDV